MSILETIAKIGFVAFAGVFLYMLFLNIALTVLQWFGRERYLKGVLRLSGVVSEAFYVGPSDKGRKRHRENADAG